MLTILNSGLKQEIEDKIKEILQLKGLLKDRDNQDGCTNSFWKNMRRYEGAQLKSLDNKRFFALLNKNSIFCNLTIKT